MFVFKDSLKGDEFIDFCTSESEDGDIISVILNFKKNWMRIDFSAVIRDGKVDKEIKFIETFKKGKLSY